MTHDHDVMFGCIMTDFDEKLMEIDMNDFGMSVNTKPTPSACIVVRTLLCVALLSYT